MKKLVLTLSLVVFLFGVSGCEKEPVETGKIPEPQITVCNVENPLTDLAWLIETIKRMEERPEWSARIYQCTYRDGVGFLIEPCVNCADFGTSLCDCNGNSLCTEGTLLGGDMCQEYAIDIESIQLIWEYVATND